MPLILRHRDEWDPHLALLPRRDDDEGFETIHSYRVAFHWRGQEYYLTVPKAMPTDLTSLPAIARIRHTTWGKYTAGAVVHDCLCRFKLGCDEMASDLYEAIMLADGVDEVTVSEFADATRLFGPRFDNPPDGVILSTERFWVKT